MPHQKPDPSRLGPVFIPRKAHRIRPLPVVFGLFEGIALFGLLTILPGCAIHQAFYVSPFNGNSPGYASIPLKADSLKSATYANAAYFAASANDHGRDDVSAFHFEVSRAHNFHFLQAWYGVNLALGTYRVQPWDSSYFSARGNSFDAKAIDQHAGNHFFGGTGARGGINAVVTRGNQEWRVLGLETSFEHEFGDYLNFRKQLPDSAATLLVKSNFFGTIGLYTELLGKTRKGDFGFRFALGWILGSAYNNLNIYDDSKKRYLRYRYYDFIYHYTYQRYTGYLQIDAATKTTGLHLGFNYRLGR